jgi:hypothetical protein
VGETTLPGNGLILFVGLLWLTLTMLAGACQPEPPGPSALGAALLHARTVIAEGEIQVSPDTVAEAFDGSLAGAAEEAGFSFGPDHHVVRCRGFQGCEALGPFRGLVHVVEYDAQDQDLIVVTLRMLRFTARLQSPYEQVDRIHITRSGREEPWRISEVIGISES